MRKPCGGQRQGSSGALALLLPLLVPVASFGPAVRAISTWWVPTPPLSPEVEPLRPLIKAGSLEAREAALALLEGHRPLLRFLPMEEISSVRFADDMLEFDFDFGRRSSRRVELPSVSKWVVDTDGLTTEQALLSRRAERVKTRARTLIVNQTLRFYSSGTDLAGVEDGDLEIAYGMFAPNVSLSTEHRPGDVARDASGRIVLEVDEQGLPIRKDGRWVPRRSNRWLVLEVKGRRFELALDPRSPTGSVPPAVTAGTRGST